ncbi:hypothetical protein ElyMa_004397400 [Elysia marginata]|uniref:Uncharacterized protein n=1 Tax=Elysia marginata TaxID=1093978 RepID=A0AAV4HBT4_9GAST|nr:hypothetical protein ElyMa_004397400 [Elysia marginata]
MLAPEIAHSSYLKERLARFQALAAKFSNALNLASQDLDSSSEQLVHPSLRSVIRCSVCGSRGQRGIARMKSCSKKVSPANLAATTGGQLQRVEADDDEEVVTHTYSHETHTHARAAIDKLVRLAARWETCGGKRVGGCASITYRQRINTHSFL